jgi:TonB family protein
VPGVSVSGGSSIVNLSSFGDAPSADDPKLPGRSHLSSQQRTLDVTVVATASSGGAFEPYKNRLRGEVYTTYVDTTIGTVVMEFADESTANHSGGTLTGPSKIRADLPAGLPHARMVVKCTLDASGDIRNVTVLEPGSAVMTAKVVAALRGWKFEPAMRGTQPVEVSAILGFNIDTNDRF